jgi:hypothetical protein
MRDTDSVWVEVERKEEGRGISDLTPPIHFRRGSLPSAVSSKCKMRQDAPQTTKQLSVSSEEWHSLLPMETLQTQAYPQ